MSRLRTRPILCCVVALAALAGCGRQGPERLPQACRDGASSVREALRAAPAKVRLGHTPLSECLGDESDSGELRDVGLAFVQVAARLAAASAQHPDGRAATELGYLMGAVRRGASSTPGVNSELVRRLEQELVPLGRPTAAFRRGERAGRESG